MSKNIVVVDIDGTIAKVGERIKYLQQEPKDWDSFYADSFQDEPIPEIIQLVYNLYQLRYQIVFCTGRRESCRSETQKWLDYHLKHSPSMWGSKLLMRPNKNHSHDTIIKPLLLADADITVDDVAFILEDRNSMVAKWRELGFTCLQVADGDF